MKSILDRAIEEFIKNDPRKRKEVAFSEECIAQWFEKNYRKLGYEKIVKRRWNKTPDFVTIKNGKEIGVEIEYLSSDFFKHGHDPSAVDVVLCCHKDVEIKGVKIVSLDHIFITYSIEIYPKIDPSQKHVEPEDMRWLVDSMWGKKEKK